MILKIFSPKSLAKMALLTQNTASLCIKLIITLVSRKHVFLSKNWEKYPKIVIITSAPFGRN
jgi:hypothetical protein